ncbi:MAG: flagellar basal body-associated FliL family protein [Treponema sp.]|jgi:flagellar FliL protein|nr:flagellar basal body-associated FliL family protein [Treponema sp.]
MGDDDGLDLGGEDVAGIDGGAKKSGGLGAFLPNLLKFVAIGLGALIFIVTVTIITVNILGGRGESQTTIDPASEYIGTRPQYSTFTLIGQLNTRTRDQNYTVVVEMLIEYDLNNNAAATELTARVNQLRDFTRNYFASKYADELRPENEENLKQEIRELLNTRYLDTAKARNILFNKLDVMEMQ